MRRATWLLALAIGCKQKAHPPTIVAEPAVDAHVQDAKRPPLRYLVHGKVVDLHTGKIERTVTAPVPSLEVTDERQELAYVLDEAELVRAFRLSDGGNVWTSAAKCPSLRLSDRHVVCADAKEIRALDRATGASRVIFSSSASIAAHEVHGSTLAVVEHDEHRLTSIDIATGAKNGVGKAAAWSSWNNALVGVPPGVCIVSRSRPAIDLACYGANMNVVWAKRDPGTFVHGRDVVGQSGPNHFVLNHDTSNLKHWEPAYSLVVSWRDRSLRWLAGVVHATVDRPDGSIEYLIMRDGSHAKDEAPPANGPKVIYARSLHAHVSSPTRVFLYDGDDVVAIDRATGTEAFRTGLPTCPFVRAFDLRDDALVAVCDGDVYQPKKRIRFAVVLSATDGRKRFFTEAS